MNMPIRKSPALLEKHRADLARCVKCGACRAVCPSFLDEREESLSARGRIALIKAVLDGRLSVSEVFEDRLETCMTCLACEGACASNVPVSDIIQAAREQAVCDAGPGLLKIFLGKVLRSDRVMRLAAWTAPLMLHYSAASTSGHGRVSRSKFKAQCSKTENARQRRGRVVFFPGCAVNYFQPDIGTAAVNVLAGMGFEVLVPEGLQCCGRPLLSLGDRKSAAEAAGHNAALLDALEADAFVTACASCGLTFKKEYPKLLKPGTGMPAVQDIHEFLSENLKSLRVTDTRVVTWHDPCHLGRGQGLAGTARELLGRIRGIRLIEMKNADRCCGFGGVMRATHPELSDRAAEKKITSIIAANVPAVVTGCPGCRMQIAAGIERTGSKVAVLHTVQVLEEALQDPDCGLRIAE